MEKSFVKWVGGKSRILTKVIDSFPEKYNTLIEPFVGSGVVGLNVSSFWILNDINSDLIDCYKYIKNMDPSIFIHDLNKLFTENSNTSEIYYTARNLFNRSNNIYLKSLLFIYLNRHGYNGLCRYNSKGIYNVPYGRYSKPYFPEQEILLYHKRLQLSEIYNIDFEEIFNLAKEGDLIYCDPPYLNTFSNYNESGFTLKDHERLLNKAVQLKEYGITTIISNSMESKYLYLDCQNILDIEVLRSVGSTNISRGNIYEILVIV